MFHCWHNSTVFERLHKQIRKLGRRNKKMKLDAFLKDNVTNALTNRMHDWYRNIRKLCPKQPYRKIQIFDEYGAPLMPHQELRSLVHHFRTLFIDDTFELQPSALTALPFTQADLEAGLEPLPVTRALGPDGFPALVWKYFASDIATVVYPAIHQAWVLQQGIPPEGWSTRWLHLLSKPHKTPNNPTALRPICLQHPINRVTTGLHCTQIMKAAFPRLRSVPLYAYLPDRGTKDCLLIVSDHCREVKSLCQKHHRDSAANGLWGGIQVSLDLEKYSMPLIVSWSFVPLHFMTLTLIFVS